MKKIVLIIALFLTPWTVMAAGHNTDGEKAKEHAGKAADAKEHAGKSAKEHAGKAADSKEHAGKSAIPPLEVRRLGILPP